MSTNTPTKLDPGNPPSEEFFKQRTAAIQAEIESRRLHPVGTFVKVKAHLEHKPHPNPCRPISRHQRVEVEDIGTYRNPSSWKLKVLDSATLTEQEVHFHIIDLASGKYIYALSADVLPLESDSVASGGEVTKDPTPKVETRSILPGYQPRHTTVNSEQPPAVLPPWAKTLLAAKDARIAELETELNKLRPVEAVAKLPPPLYTPNLSPDAAQWLCDFLEVASC